MGVEPSEKIENLFMRSRIKDQLDALREDLIWLEEETKQWKLDRKLMITIEDRIRFLKDNEINVSEEENRLNIIKQKIEESEI